VKLINNLHTESGWEIIEEEFDPQNLTTTGSNFLVGNGYLGYRGTMLEWHNDRYTACIVTDTYDQADGNWKELCNVPNGLFTKVTLGGESLSLFQGTTRAYRRVLDLKAGILTRSQEWEGNAGQPVKLTTERFASFADVHLIALRCQLDLPDFQNQPLSLRTGIDGEVWNLQGDHFRSYRIENIPSNTGHLGSIMVETKTVDEGIRIMVMEGFQIKGSQPTQASITHNRTSIYRDFKFKTCPATPLTLDKFVAVYTSNDTPEPLEKARDSLQKALILGYEEVKNQHCKEWDRLWSASDIQIKGDLEDQAITRFNLYHNIIATPTHAPLPIGARGLSTQVYQGAAFWDQEIFNLPMFTYTQPEVARNILTYRYQTLDGARHKAKRLGYEGAYFAWTSGKTGRELFPDFFFTDVLTGRKVRNHFNDWQIHISPDIIYALWMYDQATGDRKFLHTQGAEVLFEVARFLYSYAFFDKGKNRFEFIRLLGPDEYHENVDNNAFTNYQAHFALQKAVEVHRHMTQDAPHHLQRVADKIDLTEEEIRGWEEMIDLLYLPQPDPETLLIEQFDGYFQLEDIRPQQLKERLIDPDEYWGWPNGIAVHTQVMKQADVIQLLALHDIFPTAVIQANYSYYEPRTEHGSSLSPSVHALAACKAHQPQEAYDYFKESSTIDLYNRSKKVVSGGTFLGGIHTAACGATWEIIIKGFAGFRWRDGSLSFRPFLPDRWRSIHFNLKLKGQKMGVSMDHEQVTVEIIHGENPVSLHVMGKTKQITPGMKATLNYSQRP